MGMWRLGVLEISEAKRTELTSLSARRITALALALRARIVLGCATGDQTVNTQIERISGTGN